MTNLHFGLASQALFLHQNPQIKQIQHSQHKLHHVDILQNALDERDRMNAEDEIQNRPYVGKPMTKFIDQLPYVEASSDYARKYGPVLLKPVRDALRKSKRFQPTNRCTFKKSDQGDALIDHKRYRFICFYGIVSDYRIKILHHQAFVFVMVRNVIGMRHDRPLFVTNHLWIDPSFMECLMAKNSHTDRRIGIGDFILFAGAIKRYRGWIGHHHAWKNCLRNTYIAAAGYPVIRHHQFHYGFLAYDHGPECLYYIHNDQIKLGGQISKSDVDLVTRNHYEVGNYAKLMVSRAVDKWLRGNDQALDYVVTTPQVDKSCGSYWTGNTCVEFRPTDQISSQTVISKDESTVPAVASHLVWIRLKNKLGDKLYPYLLSVPHFYNS